MIELEKFYQLEKNFGFDFDSYMKMNESEKSFFYDSIVKTDVRKEKLNKILRKK